MAYSRQTSVEQFEMDKSALPQRPAAGQGSWWSRLTKKTKLILAAVIAVVVIGLAVGLGVGLTVGKGGNSGDNNTPPASTFSATPSPGPTNIWQPAVNSSWQIVLLYPLNLNEQNTSVSPDVDVYDIDMFNNNETVINKLHDLGKKVICYFSAGSFEDWRDDAGDFKDSDKGKNLDGWPGEKWIDTNSDNVRSIMKTRIEYAANKGCDAVDPDNVDAYNNDNGLGLTQSDAINYIQYLASVALPLNMSIGLKNAGEIIPDVLNVTQFSVNEQCVEFSECTTFSPFIEAAKPVFNIEYPKNIPSIKTTDTNTICDDSGKSAGSSGFSILMKNMNLNGWVQYCDGSVYNTTVSTTSTNSTSS